MFGVDNSGSALDTVAHIIQVALTPVFLLSGIATLLNVFSTRLARVADRVEAVSEAIEGVGADAAKALSAQLGIAADRFETDGKGDTQTVASNAKPEGRAMNRRVEFAKL